MIRCLKCYSIMEYYDKIHIFDPPELIIQTVYRCPNCNITKTVDD